jgi:hypothetical protein
MHIFLSVSYPWEPHSTPNDAYACVLRNSTPRRVCLFVAQLNSKRRACRFVQAPNMPRFLALLLPSRGLVQAPRMPVCCAPASFQRSSAVRIRSIMLSSRHCVVGGGGRGGGCGVPDSVLADTNARAHTHLHTHRPNTHTHTHTRTHIHAHCEERGDAHIHVHG